MGKIRDGLLDLTISQQESPQIVVGFEELRINLQSLGKMLEGLLPISLCHSYDPQVVVGIGKFRVEIQGFGEITGSPIEVSLFFRASPRLYKTPGLSGLISKAMESCSIPLSISPASRKTVPRLL